MVMVNSKKTYIRANPELKVILSRMDKRIKISFWVKMLLTWIFAGNSYIVSSFFSILYPFESSCQGSITPSA